MCGLARPRVRSGIATTRGGTGRRVGDVGGDRGVTSSRREGRVRLPGAGVGVTVQPRDAALRSDAGNPAFTAARRQPAPPLLAAVVLVGLVGAGVTQVRRHWPGDVRTGVRRRARRADPALRRALALRAPHAAAGRGDPAAAPARRAVARVPARPRRGRPGVQLQRRVLPGARRRSARARPPSSSPSGGVASYWHRRASGDWARYVLDEVIPQAVQAAARRPAARGDRRHLDGRLRRVLDRAAAAEASARSAGTRAAMWLQRRRDGAGRVRRRRRLRAQRRRRARARPRPPAVGQRAAVARRRHRRPVPPRRTRRSRRRSGSRCATGRAGTRATTGGRTTRVPALLREALRTHQTASSACPT